MIRKPLESHPWEKKGHPGRAILQWGLHSESSEHPGVSPLALPWPWVSRFTSFCLSFLICKMRVVPSYLREWGGCLELGFAGGGGTRAKGSSGLALGAAALEF